MKFRQATPFGYRAKATPLHRLPAGIKLLCVIILSMASYASVYGLAAALAALLASSAAARIPPWELLKGSKALALMSLCVIMMHYRQPAFALILAMRLFVPFIAAALLFAVTTMRELRLSLAALEMKIAKTSYASLGISLMLGFIPRFFELWEAASLACDARAFKRGPRRLLLIVPLVTERMMERAACTAEALEARNVMKL